MLDIMYAKAPYATLQRAVHIHPTVSEIWLSSSRGLELGITLYTQSKIDSNIAYSWP